LIAAKELSTQGMLNLARASRFQVVSVSHSPVNVASGRGVELAVVLPTYNERDNIGEVIGRVEVALDGLPGGLCWEMVFVDDDSPDGTAEVVREYARRDPRIRLVHRVGRRGLSSACIEGIMATTANVIAVMDADLQHDERILPKMVARLREESLDVVVGTRNAMGGSMGQFSKRRVLLSRIGNVISQAVCRCAPSDPMSGFFVVRRSFFLEVVPRLQGNGFKILVDMLSSSERPVRFGEVGYCFRKRTYGESKLDVNTAVEYLFLILSKLMGGVVPLRFAMFALVGATGVLAHLGCLAVLLFGLHVKFLMAQTVATVVAMTENFFLNNLITYRDRSLRGVRLVSGLVSFWVACSFGAWANVVFARALLSGGTRWYLAGLAGIVLSSVWNYSISNLFTWQMPVQGQCADAGVEALAEQMDILR
jgi:dolichol-phosphate mannosyltransferase